MQSETHSTMIIQIVLLSVYGQATAAAGSESESSKTTAKCYTVHSEIFSQICLILKNRFLVRLSSNFQERLFVPSSSPEFLLSWGYF